MRAPESWPSFYVRRGNVAEGIRMESAYFSWSRARSGAWRVLGPVELARAALEAEQPVRVRGGKVALITELGDTFTRDGRELVYGYVAPPRRAAYEAAERGIFCPPGWELEGETYICSARDEAIAPIARFEREDARLRQVEAEPSRAARIERGRLVVEAEEPDFMELAASAYATYRGKP